MRLLSRLFFISCGAMALIYGVQNFRINQVPRTFTMEEVEREGIGSARYIIVTGARSNGDHGIIKTFSRSDPKEKHTSGAILPLYSEERLLESDEKSRPPTSLIYKLNARRGCLQDGTCGEAGSVDVRGVVHGDSLWDIGDTKYANRYPHAANFIYVAEGEPLARPFCLLFAFGGGVILFLALQPRRNFDKYVTGQQS